MVTQRWSSNSSYRNCATLIKGPNWSFDGCSLHPVFIKLFLFLLGFAMWRTFYLSMDMDKCFTCPLVSIPWYDQVTDSAVSIRTDTHTGYTHTCIGYTHTCSLWMPLQTSSTISFANKEVVKRFSRTGGWIDTGMCHLVINSFTDSRPFTHLLGFRLSTFIRTDPKTHTMRRRHCW